MDKLNKMKEPLRKWNKERFGNIDSNIQKLEDELARVSSKIEDDSVDQVVLAIYNALRSLLEKWHARKCYYWQQMSRVHKVKDVDCN